MSTSPTLDPRERVVAALTAQDGTLRNAGLALVIDHVLAQPFAAWLDADTISTWIVQALSRPNTEREIARHVAPGVQRVLATLRASQERVGDAVPEEARAKLEALVTNPRGPRFAWMKGAVDADKLRALLAPVLQEIFVGFAGRIAPAGGGSAAGAAVGMVGRLGRGAGERLLNLGKSVADGLGVDVEARLREAARDYSQGAATAFQRAITARLATPEGAALIEGVSRNVLDHVLKTPISVILDDLDRLPLRDAIALAAPILEHDLPRELWRSILDAEIRATLALEAQRPLRDLLEEAGLLTQTRDHLLARANDVSRELFASQAFADWLDQLLG